MKGEANNCQVHAYAIKLNNGSLEVMELTSCAKKNSYLINTSKRGKRRLKNTFGNSLTMVALGEPLSR